MLISVVIPCFNEAESLPLFIQRILPVMKKIDCPYELLFVDDGSNDETLAILKQMSRDNQNIFYLSFSRNFGKEAAMLAGMTNAKGEYVAVMDADLQDPPELLEEMFGILEKGNYDCVAAKRSNRKKEPVIRSLFAKSFYKMMNRISDEKIEDGARDFRMMKREMVDAILSMQEYNRFSKGIFSWVGFETFWLSYENVERANGKTKWSFWKLFQYGMDGLMNFSQTPLSVASWFGIFMTGISFLALMFIIIRKLLFGDPVAGWASTVCIIVFIGGLQLFCLGIIGQYIAKIYMETKKRPHFIISESNRDDMIKIK
ncbi:MAG: glycosyltransferase family 2 protein [Solobacterium sp.]|nr:glycosyltransferase family 2 protein [Solobacterium sp.]